LPKFKNVLRIIRRFRTC